MVSTIFIRVLSRGWGEQPPRWGEMILNLHQYLGSWSVQGGIVVESQRREFRRAFNLARSVLAKGIFPLPLLFFLFLLVGWARCRGSFYQYGFLDISILLYPRKYLGKASRKLLLEAKKEHRGLQAAFHGRHGDHGIQVDHLQSDGIKPGDEFLEGFILFLFYPN